MFNSSSRLERSLRGKVSIFKTIQSAIVTPIHPAGYPFITIFALVTISLGIFSGLISFFLGLVLSAWCIYFFRNPVRYSPQRIGLVLAPADGRIISIAKLQPPKELELPGNDWTRIAIFMNVFDVHVNRAPMTGDIVNRKYFSGKFLNASLNKASDKNERLSLIMQTKYGNKIAFVQIAGLVARRILSHVKVNEKLNAGEQYGIIRFGSRVDVWLPNPVEVRTAEGQKTVAGETIIADFQKQTGIGEIRVE